MMCLLHRKSKPHALQMLR